MNHHWALWLVLLTGILFNPPASAAAGDEAGLIDLLSDVLGTSEARVPKRRTVQENEGRRAAPAQASRTGASAAETYRAATDLLAEVTLIREELGTSDFPAEAELQEFREPVHVYVKSGEVLAKVRRLQNRFGVEPTDAGSPPSGAVTPGDVLANIEHVSDALRAVKEALAIEREIEPAPLQGSKTFSLTYQLLAEASLLLDGVTGDRLTPTDVHRRMVSVLDETELIAAELGSSFEQTIPVVEGSKSPKDVAQQLQRAAYKAIAIQNRVGMQPSGVSSLTLVRVTPTENHDLTGVLLAELLKIKAHLGLDAVPSERPTTERKTVNDVYALTLLVVRNLDGMAEALRPV